MKNHTESLITLFRENAIFNRVDIDSTFDDLFEELQVIRAAVTSKFQKRAEPWMLPRWMNLSKSPNLDDETLLYNDEHNNSIVIGGVGSDNFAIMDSAGLISPANDFCSVDFWFQSNDELVIPGSDIHHEHMEILSPEDQIYEMKQSKASVTVQRLIYFVAQDDNEFVFNEVLLKNTSLEPASYTFFVTVRPFNHLGIIPTKQIDFDEEQRHLYADDRLALILDSLPDALILSTADNPTLLNAALSDTERRDTSYSTKRGLATAVLRFEVTLGPAERKSMFFAIPLPPLKKDEESVQPRLTIAERDAAIQNWFEFSGRKLAGTYPTEGITRALSQAKASLAIQAKSEILASFESPDMRSMIDTARTLVALSRCGCSNVLREIFSVDEFPLISNADSFLPTIWAFSEVERIDRATVEDAKDLLLTALRKYGPKIIQNFESKYEKETVSPSDMYAERTNLVELSLPKIPPHSEFSIYNPNREEFSLSDVPYLLLITHFFEIVGNNEGTIEGVTNQRIQSLKESSREILLQAEDQVLSQEPSNILKIEDDARIALNLVGLVSLLRDNTLGTENLRNLANSLHDNHTSNGLFQPDSERQQVSSHLSLQLAHFFALHGDRERAEVIFNQVIDFRSTFDFLPDYINLKTGKGGLGTGCSIDAACDLIILVRDMLIVEDRGNLIVARGVPEDWFTTETPLIVKGIPTAIGRVGIELAPSANQHQIEITMERLPEELEFIIPSHISLNMVKTYGGSIIDRIEERHAIRIVPFSESLVLVYHRL